MTFGETSRSCRVWKPQLLAHRWLGSVKPVNPVQWGQVCSQGEPSKYSMRSTTVRFRAIATAPPHVVLPGWKRVTYPCGAHPPTSSQLHGPVAREEGRIQFAFFTSFRISTAPTKFRGRERTCPGTIPLRTVWKHQPPIRTLAGVYQANGPRPMKAVLIVGEAVHKNSCRY